MGKRREEFLYEKELRALNAAKINYVVCGGVAVVLFGYTRLTLDLDLIVSLERENLKKLYDALMRLGYKPRIPIKKEEFIQKEKLKKLAKEKNMKVFSFFDPKDSTKLVDIGVNLPNIEEILKRKKHIKIDKYFTVPIIKIDDLIKMKEDAARPKDIIDAENLKRIKREIK